MRLSTRKIEAGRYRVICNGKPTDIVIEKDTQTRRKWGSPQNWWVCEEPEESTNEDPPLLFETGSKAAAVDTLMRVHELLEKAS